MGMFDYVEIESDSLKGEFQTKSLYCCLERYVVRHGKLHIYVRNKDKLYEINHFSGRMFLNKLDEDRRLLYYTLEFDEGKLVQILDGVVEEGVE